jgi:hypothetical protein
MGQTSLPNINRSGYYSYWNNSWDSKSKYQLFFIKFFFLKNFFYKFFKTKFFFNKFILFNQKKFIKTNLFFYKNYLSVLSLEKNFNVRKNLNMCISKTWILKYQSFIVITLLVFSPRTCLIKKKKNFKKLFLSKKKIFFIKKKNFLKKRFRFNFFFKKRRRDSFFFKKKISLKVYNFYKNKFIKFKNRLFKKKLFIFKTKKLNKLRNIFIKKKIFFLKKKNSFVNEIKKKYKHL